MSEHQYGEVTIERVERGLAVLAYIMTLDSGAKYALLFEKLEGELEAMRRQDGTVERAKRLLESYGRHPRLSLAPPITSEDPETSGTRCSQHRAPTST